MRTRTPAPELPHTIDACWRADNYLSGGRNHLRDNPLLKRPPALADVKRMLLGRRGTTPGQNFIYAHLDEVIEKYDLDMIDVSGPGRGGPARVLNAALPSNEQSALVKSAAVLLEDIEQHELAVTSEIDTERQNRYATEDRI